MTLIQGYFGIIELCHSDRYDLFLADMELRCLDEIGVLLRYNHNHDPHTGRFTSGSGVDNSGESGIIENKECEIAPDKINKFFLKPNAKHAKEFFDVGYKPTDFELLDKDLKASFDYSKAVDKVVLDNGVERFSIFTELGVDKKKRFRTVWQKDTSESIPRIITVHREDE